MYRQPVDIRPSQSWLNLRLGEVWQYRDLILLLVHRDFAARFKQTILGPAWFFLTPLAMSLVMNLVFKKIANVPTDDVPGPLFYMAGLFAWNLVSTTFNNVALTFISNAPLFSKVYFPRLVVPMALGGTSLINTAIQLVSFGCLFAWFVVMADTVTFWPGWNFLFLIPVVGLALGLGLGLGLIFTSLTAKYRDLKHMLPFLTQIWLFASAVVFPISSIPAGYHTLAAVNPAIGIVALSRSALLGEPLPPTVYLAFSAGITLVALLCGAFLFNRAQRTFVDTV